ncbi:MAG: HYExAFE family protein [Planctomycetes bacterium]|nr:HYExAFE family protein [Planctomycetota bacterium]
MTNHYEQAFAGWLIDNGFQHVAVDQQKRKILARSSIKTFDFLLYPPAGKLIVAELKGRKFKGSVLANMTGLECWVGIDDIRGLSQWEQVFDDPGASAGARAGAGAGAEAFFIFAYELENVDVDTDGREIYCFNDRQYMFLAISLTNYRAFMTDRSPSWQTVTMPAARFRQFAIPARRLMSGRVDEFSGDVNGQMTGVCAGV